MAPYVAANQAAAPRDGLGSPLATDDAEFDGGVDAKWIPNPSTAIDATVNPDFSQIESDAGQITANERFALFYPEKRPFFLEGVNLLQTPIQAVYTRTFTSPRFGLRATGGSESTKYTALVGEDRGGGSVILPGPEGSGFADQDFASYVAVTRARHDFAKAFVSFLYTGRENASADGGGSNHVAGPDFEWRPTPQDTVTGQLLFSWSDTPDRPDLAEEWDGRELSGHAAKLWAQHATETWDLFGQYEDFSDDFRADNGFVPQVGYRMLYVESGRTWRPVDKPVSRLRLFAIADRAETQGGELLSQELVPGLGLDATWNSFVRFEFAFDEVVDQGVTYERFRFRPRLEIRPGKDPPAGDPAGGLRRRRRLREPPSGRRLAGDGDRRPATDRPPRAGPLRRPPDARRRRGYRRIGALGHPLHRRPRAAARGLHLQRQELAAADRRVGRRPSATRRSTPSRYRRRAPTSRARRSSPTSSTGRPSSSSASATSAPRIRTATCSPSAARRSSRSPTPSSASG